MVMYSSVRAWIAELTMELESDVAAGLRDESEDEEHGIRMVEKMTLRKSLGTGEMM
jgi:hypothetical protein